MKVIKQGPDTTKPFSFESECKDCESKLLVEEKDLRYESDQRDGDSLVYKCMVCGVENWVGLQGAPRHVLRRISG